MDIQQGTASKGLLSVDWTTAHPVKKSGDQPTFAKKNVSASPNTRRKLEALDLTKTSGTDINPLHKKSVRENFRMPVEESVEDLRRKSGITPPDYLTDSEYFELSKLLCDRLSDDEIDAIPSQVLKRFARQAIKDVNYMTMLARKGVAEHDKIPKSIRPTVLAKLLGLQKAYSTLLIDFAACKKTFARGDKIQEEREVYKPIDDTNRYMLMTSPTDMVVLLKNRWKQLIRYMDQLRDMMPAPSECCSGQPIPNILLAQSPVKMPLDEKRMMFNVLPKMESLRDHIHQMEDNWSALEAAINSGKIPPYVVADKFQFHVCLPNEAKPLPPSYDITSLVNSKSSRFASEMAAPKTLIISQEVSKNSESAELDSRKEFFSSEAEAQARKKELDLADKEKLKATKKNRAKLSLNVPDVKQVSSANPKHKEYFGYQPVALDTLRQALNKGKRLTEQAAHPLNGLIIGTKDKYELTEDEYGIFQETYEKLKQSVELWGTHIPSIQQVYDFVYEEENLLKKGARAVSHQLKGAVRTASNVQPPYLEEKKRKTLFQRRTTDTDLAQQNKEGQKGKVGRTDSSPQLSVAVPTMLPVIPPTPSPSGSSGSGSPRFTPSPEHKSSEERKTN